MKISLLLCLLAVSCFANIGDNAPSLPPTFKMAHPRLGAPDSAFLTTLWTNRAGSAARIFNAANAWNSANVLLPSASLQVPYGRYLLLAYLAANQAGDSSATTYLTQIRALANLNGGWGTLYANGTDGITTGTPGISCSGSNPCTLTSASTNFLTACAGGSCVGKYISIGGINLPIASVTGTAQANFTGGSQPMLTIGTGVHWSAVSTWPGMLGIVWVTWLTYDWLYNVIDAASGQPALDANAKATFLASMKGYQYQYQSFQCLGPAGPPTCNNTLDPGPFSDTSYTRIQMNAMVGAIAEYEPGDAQSLADLRYALDMWWNILIPGWKLVWGGDYCSAENDAGTRTSNNVYQPGCGGGWHDGWTDYVNPPGANGQTQIFLPSLLAFANAYGQMNPVTCTFPDGSAQTLPSFFCTHSWIKNYAYFMMYKTRPDWQEEQNGSVARGTLSGESTMIGSSGIAPFGSLDGLGEIFNDATLRSWARALNRGWCSGVPCVPDGNEPSAWPYYPPDNSSHSVVAGANPRVNLGRSRLFQGWGKIYARTGWGEDDSSCSFVFSGNYWSHPEMDIGNFNCFSRGAVLLGYSGCSYRAGSNADCVQNYKIQAIAHNVPLIYDPNDIYTAEGSVLGVGRNDSSLVNMPFPNDGGQRRVGSAISNKGGAGMQTATQQPATVGMYKQNYEYYHMGDLIGYQVGPSNSYTYAAIDITASFNNHWSAMPYNSGNLWAANTANSSNRSYRCQGCTRSFTFIPSKNGLTGNGTAAYLVVYDDIIAANSSLMKKDVIHFINQPVISGNQFTWTRAELATSYPFNFMTAWLPMLSHASGNTYQYSAQGYGWCMLPSPCNMTKIGGVGAEFEITDAAGTKNHNECAGGQCTSLSGSITGLGVEPFNVTGSNNILLIAIDGGANQTITLTTGTGRTATQIVAEINGQITGATATVEGQDPNAPANTQGRVAITSNSTTGGASNVALTAVTNSAYTFAGDDEFFGRQHRRPGRGDGRARRRPGGRGGHRASHCRDHTA